MLPLLLLVTVSGTALPAEKRAFEIDDVYRCAGVGAPEVSRDGARVAFTVRRYDLAAGKTWSEIWMMNADGSGLRQMTAGKHGDADPRFAPDGRSIVFSSDRGDGGQLWILPTDGGEPRQLTDFAPGLSGPVWSPDGRWIAAASEIRLDCGIDADCHERITKAREKGKIRVHVADDLLYRHWTSWGDGARTHVLLVDAASGAVVKDLTPGRWESPTFSLGGDRGYVFSPDAQELCFVSNHDEQEATSTNADLWVVPVEGEVTSTTAVNLTDENDGWDGAPLYSPDGRWIAYLSQATPGYESDLRRIALYDRQARSTRYLTDRAVFDDAIDDVQWSPDSRSLVFQAQRRGRTPLYRIALAGGAPEELLAHGTIGGFALARDGAEVVYSHRAVAQPTELFAARPGAGEPRRLTTFNRAIEEEVDLQPAEEHWFDGDGDYQVHCFVVRPHGFDPAQKYPLILNVHGGPQSQWTDAFRGDWQVYPGRGYVVAFCNPTGSTGYGQDFTDAIAKDYGGRVFRDLMKVTDALERLSFVDPQRVGVMGWSFGGYMTMWMQGHTDRYRCIASMMGLFDLRSFYGETEELWFPEHDLGGAPWESTEYERWSPSNAVRNFKTPALVITGEKDYRVSYTQSLQYYTALRKLGVPARLVVFPGAGHWPSWTEMTFYYNAHLEFFHDYLGGGAAPWDVHAHADGSHLEAAGARD